MTAIPKPERIKDSKRLAFVRQMRCLVYETLTEAPFDTYFDHLQVCGSPDGEPSEAHHVRHGANSGVGTKPSDYLTVPLCEAAHREYHQLGHSEFQAKYGLDLEEHIQRINQAYRAQVKPSTPAKRERKTKFTLTVKRCVCGDDHILPLNRCIVTQPEQLDTLRTSIHLRTVQYYCMRKRQYITQEV